MKTSTWFGAIFPAFLPNVEQELKSYSPLQQYLPIFFNSGYPLFQGVTPKIPLHIVLSLSDRHKNYRTCLIEPISHDNIIRYLKRTLPL
jgi:hypothetical protein